MNLLRFLTREVMNPIETPSQLSCANLSHFAFSVPKSGVAYQISFPYGASATAYALRLPDKNLAHLAQMTIAPVPKINLDAPHPINRRAGAGAAT